MLLTLIKVSFVFYIAQVAKGLLNTRKKSPAPKLSINEAMKNLFLQSEYALAAINPEKHDECSDSVTGGAQTNIANVVQVESEI